jgi:hypothetical protein
LQNGCLGGTAGIKTNSCKFLVQDILQCMPRLVVVMWLVPSL